MGWLSDIFDDPMRAARLSAAFPSPEYQTNARPKLRIVGKAPTREEFSAWWDHPISQMVFAGLIRNAEECEEAWLAASWGQGKADQLLLTELRTRADALRSLVDAPYEAWVEILDLEMKNDE